ncbi:MAG: universal stress protein [Burkholderiaceae bacterium]|nr:universal stress protein [Burkholderiaceae bacterium]
MSYKTILVHVDQSRHLGPRVAAAASLALAENAHLIGVAMTGISRFAYQSGAPTLAAHLETLRARAAGALAEFEALARGLGVASIETRLVDDDAAGGISVQARYCDLVVVGQTDLRDPSPAVPPDFPEYVLMHCGRPLLIVPHAGGAPFAADKILVAWDASMEATHAVGGALPLLRRAGRVDLVVFNPDPHSEQAHGAQPGADIALYLARHGIAVEVTQQHTEADIGAALLAKAAALSSDLIVMGGYGHSRLREIVLGGTTRSVLDAAAVPVLMAH